MYIIDWKEIMDKSFKKAIKKKNGSKQILYLVLLIIFIVTASTTQRTAKYYDVHNIMMELIQDTKQNGSVENIFEVPVEHNIETPISFDTSEICFIGDDRTISMKETVLTDVRFISLRNGNADWLCKEAITEFGNMKDVKVCVIALGVNDIKNVEMYIKTMNDFANQHKNIVFIYINVGPVKDDSIKEYTNKNICLFNDRMLNGLNEKWIVIDQYSYLMETGFTMVDDVNYSKQDSSRLFLWLISTIKKQPMTIKT